jgi:hypothetical protein
MAKPRKPSKKKVQAEFSRRTSKTKKPLHFTTWFISKLRSVSQKWPPIYEAKNKAKVYVTVEHVDGNIYRVAPDGGEAFLVEDDRLKSGRRVMWRCNYCKLLWFDKRWEKAKTGRWVKRSGVAVDHVIPIVDPNHTGWTWDQFVQGLFHGETQVLCHCCHSLKSHIENEERWHVRRERKQAELEDKESKEEHS